MRCSPYFCNSQGLRGPRLFGSPAAFPERGGLREGRGWRRAAVISPHGGSLASAYADAAKSVDRLLPPPPWPFPPQLIFAAVCGSSGTEHSTPSSKVTEPSSGYSETAFCKQLPIFDTFRRQEGTFFVVFPRYPQCFPPYQQYFEQFSTGFSGVKSSAPVTPDTTAAILRQQYAVRAYNTAIWGVPVRPFCQFFPRSHCSFCPYALSLQAEHRQLCRRPACIIHFCSSS
jgi:hypothetical protein